MKTKIIGLLVLLTVCLSSCNGMNKNYWGMPEGGVVGGVDVNEEEYLEIVENDFLDVAENPLSTFSLDSSTAAYSNLRRIINAGGTISKDMVKIEQMLNYFKYDYASPKNADLALYSEMGACPWNSENVLAAIAVKAKDYEINTTKKNNFVFLLDVSGSMYSADKLPLMQQAFSYLIDNLNDDDTISIVTYASSDQVLLSGAKGFEKTKISAIIEDLEASGSTAGAKGIQTAYSLAEKYFIEGGNNRVFLATDGDFNVGISSINDLEKFIADKKESGVYLSVLGFGEGNLKDNIMETLASKGNGQYYYVDSILEARKLFVEELGGTLETVAKDCKTQIEFNPKYVARYRLLGYENKMLSNDDFENDDVDAGEIGAGHVTMALYELVLNTDDEVPTTMEDFYFKAALRYKSVETNENVSLELFTKYDSTTTPSNNFIFAASVVECALVMRDSLYKANASYENAIASIKDIKEITDDVYKAEFISLIRKLMD